MPSSSSKCGYLLSFIYNLLIDNAKIKIILETTKKKARFWVLPFKFNILFYA